VHSLRVLRLSWAVSDGICMHERLEIGRSYPIVTLTGQ
jgi:hypothetical protein